MSTSDLTPLRLAAVQLDVVPNRITQQQRHWLPAEPLFGPNPLTGGISQPDASVAHLASQYPQFLATIRRLENRYIEGARVRLLQILEFCKNHKVHIVVFPEYSIPPALLSVLVGYSSELIVVAGIGVMRPTDIDRIDRPDSPLRCAVAPYSNCAVVVGPGRVELVTKQHGAESEFFERGSGPRTLDIALRGRTIRLGVAICMDYVHIGHPFGAEGEHLRVVALPVLSRTTDVFTPDQPRAFVRILANHSGCGGTRILLPQPAGAAFVTDGGTAPFELGEEGVVVVDFDKYQTAPSSFFSTSNRLVFRASLIASPTDFEQQLVEAIQGLPRELPNGSETSQMLDSWIERTAKDKRLHGLHEGLVTYKRLSQFGHLTEDDRVLLTNHLLVPDAQPASALREAQAREVFTTLRSLVSDDSQPNIFDAQAAYANLLASLQPALSLQSLGASAPRERQTYWALGLGRFYSDDAQNTITYQLDLLRAFSLSFPQHISLSYRLTTRENALTEDKAATFEIILGGMVPKDTILEQTEHFGRAYRAILVPGWSCYTSDAEIDATGSCVYSIEPADRGRAAAPAIRSDWGRVVDVLRAQPRTMTLDMTCSPLARENRISPASTGVAEATGGQVPLGGPAAGADAFRDFLIGQAVEHQSDTPTLELRIVVSSAYEHTQSLLNTLGSMLLGHDRFKVRSLRINGEAVPHTENSVGFSVRADEALRIFHPPHGHIEGRGLGDRNPLVLHAKSVPLTQSGCVIGKAVAARAYVDTEFKLAVDQEARLRHVYVIGKTGAGKTNLLKEMVRQDITSGTGVVVVDPHGDLAEYALGHCGGRIEECIYLDFADYDHLPVFNPLSLDIANEAARLLAVEELLEVFTRRTYHEWYGPRFEDTVRMALDTLYVRSAGAPCSILDVPGLLRDTKARESVLESLPPDSDLRDRWRVFEGMLETERSGVVNWVLAKFAEIEQSKVLRAVLVGQQSSFSLAKVIAKHMA